MDERLQRLQREIRRAGYTLYDLLDDAPIEDIRMWVDRQPQDKLSMLRDYINQRLSTFRQWHPKSGPALRICDMDSAHLINIHEVAQRMGSKTPAYVLNELERRVRDGRVMKMNDKPLRFVDVYRVTSVRVVNDAPSAD